MGILEDKRAKNKKLMLKALQNNLGLVGQSCKSVGISRGTYYKWMNEDEEFKQEVLDNLEYSIDFVEAQLYRQIKDGNPTAIIFYLKCKAKERGYVEKQEFEVKNTQPIVLELGKGVKPKDDTNDN